MMKLAMLASTAGREISKRRREQSLSAFFYYVGAYYWLKLCGHRHTSVLGDINAQHGYGGLDSCRLNMQAQTVCGR
ncbi:MAG TPA: hypothetical protein VJ249_10205 [Candidatus Bathyarchaeia archaeon]|nr:hypothetical protein [Candidatus Bathyarchaeia archaeon]